MHSSKHIRFFPLCTSLELCRNKHKEQGKLGIANEGVLQWCTLPANTEVQNILLKLNRKSHLSL